MNAPLKSPFPYFGGKSRVADLVWKRLGDVDNFVEPFAGSLAVTLRRPQPGKIETVNDANHYIVNFWRSVKQSPEIVAEFADHPVTEADLHARHRYLVLGEVAAEFRRSIESNPEYCNPQFAGWWVWGQCCWIGGGWCDTSDEIADQQRLPMIGQLGKGVTAGGAKPKVESKQVPDLAGDGEALSGGRPQLGDQFDIGRGVCGNGRALLTDERRAWLKAWMCRLEDRLRLVRVCYGNWDRICDSNTTMVRLGLTGGFLDPPYAKNLDRLRQWIAFLSGTGESPGILSDAREAEANRSGGLYTGDSSQDIDRLVAEVHLWCRKWGSNPGVRIALCGYEGEHDALEQLGWTVESWTAHGGYANRNADNQNKHRERIWFSPNCIQNAVRTLFDA